MTMKITNHFTFTHLRWRIRLNAKREHKSEMVTTRVVRFFVWAQIKKETIKILRKFVREKAVPLVVRHFFLRKQQQQQKKKRDKRNSYPLVIHLYLFRSITHRRWRQDKKKKTVIHSLHGIINEMCSSEHTKSISNWQIRWCQFIIKLCYLHFEQWNEANKRKEAKREEKKKIKRHDENGKQTIEIVCNWIIKKSAFLNWNFSQEKEKKKKKSNWMKRWARRRAMKTRIERRKKKNWSPTTFRLRFYKWKIGKWTPFELYLPSNQFNFIFCIRSASTLFTITRRLR